MSEMSDEYGCGPGGLTPDDIKRSTAMMQGPQTFEIESAPQEAEFLAEDKNGDWIRVQRYQNPFGFKHTVINNRTGKWWSTSRWMPVPSTPS